ncbi:hypothetical protein BGZ54_009774 [Gamsiella multidivaricata]|nr:hypothetical protein BGZ54_009774 [Gamsiella multidivaricata]
MSKRQDPVLHSTNAQQDLPKANGNGKANSMDKGHLAPDVKDDLQSTLRSYNQLFRSFCDTMMSDNLTQAKTTMETMRRDLTTIQTTLTKTQPPQELVLKAQRHILENQQNLLEHLSAVQGLLRTVVDRTYELMEDLSHNSNITQSAALAMNSLEIRSHVIQFLDLKDLVRCMRLNKAWHKLIVPRVWKSVRLSSNPHCCPSREAIRCHNHLIKSLEIPYPDEIAVEYYALSFPKLQKLNLTLPRQGVGSMIDAIYCWTHLRELNMRCANTEASLGFDISRLWRTVASLPNLRTLRLRDIEVCNIAVTFSSLRALKLQYTFSCPDTPSQQQAFLSHCPSLMFLEWSAAHTVHWDQTIAAKDFVRRVTARTWPILEGLSLGWNVLGLSDADIASILTVMARVSVLKVPHSDFGPLSFQGLRAHFSTLKELDLSGCFDVTQAMLLSPPRILYCRAVVFDVALKNTANGSIRKRQDPILCGTNVQQGPLKADSNDKANNNDMVNSMDKDNSMDKSHLAPDVKDDLQSTLRSCNQLFRSFCDTMMSDNLTQAKATMETMRRDLTTIQTTLTKTQPPQELRTVVDRTHELMGGQPPNTTIVKPKFMALDLPETTKIVLQSLDPRDLVKCMRLNKTWHGLAVPMVWRTLHLTMQQRWNPSFETLLHSRHLVHIISFD